MYQFLLTLRGVRMILESQENGIFSSVLVLESKRIIKDQVRFIGILLKWTLKEIGLGCINVFFISIHVIKTNNRIKNKDWVNLDQNRPAMTCDTSTAMLLRTLGCVVESGSQGLDRSWPASPEAQLVFLDCLVWTTFAQPHSIITQKHS